MIKLISTDFDDTLLNRRLEISTANLQAIKSIQKKGIYFTINTGRMHRSILPHAIKLGINIPIISYHGALIKTIEGKTLYQKTIDKELALAVLDWADQLKINAFFYADDKLYVNHINSAACAYARIAKVGVTAVGDLRHNFPGQPLKILLGGDKTMAKNALLAGEKQFGRELYITSSRFNYTEILSKDANKGNALTFLADYLDVDLASTMALGDNYNDLLHLQAAGLKIAMGNAVPPLQEIADFVAADCDDDGFAQAINRFVLFA